MLASSPALHYPYIDRTCSLNTRSPPLADCTTRNMDLAPALNAACDDYHNHMNLMTMSSVDIRASSLPAKQAQDHQPAKRKGTESDNYFPRISLTNVNDNGYWISTTKTRRRGRLRPESDSNLDMQLHQSTCLNLNADANAADSDFWILPDFDDWEVESPQQDAACAKPNGTWKPLVQRAATSNRERLRRRLEGDGWDFVGGKYGEDGKVLKEAVEVNRESVDEEFDVVVLPVVHISC